MNFLIIIIAFYFLIINKYRLGFWFALLFLLTIAKLENEFKPKNNTECSYYYAESPKGLDLNSTKILGAYK